MSTGKNDKKKTSSLYTVIYIAAVLALAGCLAFLVWDSVKKDEEFEQRVQEAAQGETEYVLAERTRETETEEMTETRPETEGETAGTAAPGTPQAGTVSGTGAGAQAESGAGTQPGGAAMAAGNLQAPILVLNGTRRAGIAAYWQSVLRTDGYSNVSTATYSPEASEHTVIYYNSEAAMLTAAALQAYFPGSGTVYGTPADGIEPSEGSPIPDVVEIYIVVGLQDAKAEETEGQTSPEGQAAGQQQVSPGGQTAGQQQTLPGSQTTGQQQTLSGGQTAGQQQTSPGGQTTGQQVSPGSQTTGQQQMSQEGQVTGQQQAPSGSQTTEPQRPVGTPT